MEDPPTLGSKGSRISSLDRISSLLSNLPSASSGGPERGDGSIIAGGLGTLCHDALAPEAELRLLRRSSRPESPATFDAKEAPAGGEGDEDDDDAHVGSPKRSAVERGIRIELRALAAARSLLSPAGRPRSPMSSGPATPPIVVHGDDADGPRQPSDAGGLASRLQRPRAHSYGSGSESPVEGGAPDPGGSLTRRSVGPVLLSAEGGPSPAPRAPREPLPKSGSNSAQSRSPRTPFVARSPSGFGSLAAGMGLGMAASASPPTSSTLPPAPGALPPAPAPPIQIPAPPFAARRTLTGVPSPLDLPRSPSSSLPGSPLLRGGSPSAFPRTLPALSDRPASPALVPLPPAATTPTSRSRVLGADPGLEPLPARAL